LATLVVAGATTLVLGSFAPGYDISYALAWGNDLARGVFPKFDVPQAPTQHPLTVAIGAALSPFGAAAGDVISALFVFSFAALVLATFRLAEELFSAAAGLVAAAVVVTSVRVAALASQGISDVPAVALILWALVLEVRQRKRGWPVMALLALAGLLRPEAWLLGAAYWLYVFSEASWGDRLRLGALAVVAPVAWLSMDLASTADPFWSLTGTQDLAEDLGRRTGVSEVPVAAPELLGELLGPGAGIAAAAGLAIGWIHSRTSTLFVIALAALNMAAFLVLAAAGLPLNARYLLLAAVMVAVLAGVGAAAWVDNRVRRQPLHLAASALSVIALLIGVFAFQATRLDETRDRLERDNELRADLTGLFERNVVDSSEDMCGPFALPNSRIVPIVAQITSRSPGDVYNASVRKRRLSPAIWASSPAAEAMGASDPAALVGNGEDTRGVLARGRHWELRGACRP
jgi:hypothetical protein